LIAKAKGKTSMTISTRSARIISPISYEKSNGKKGTIPAGPCIIEQIDEDRIDIVWGDKGQRSTSLNVAEINTAATQGSIIFLDD
jgi:hypothetical protein